EEPTADELAAALAFRLRRLEAMRKAAEELQAQPQLGRDVFGRGMPENIRETSNAYTATLYDLLSAYARQRQKSALSHVTLPRREVWTLAQARELLGVLIGEAVQWTSLDEFLIEYLAEPHMVATVRAS